MTTNSTLEEKSAQEVVRFGKEMRGQFLFAEGWRNLNHGSFGTYPKTVRTALHHYQSLAEARPDSFIRYDYPNLLDASRAAIAALVHAAVEECVFVPNATTGVNTVLRNLIFEPGDYILYTSTIYGACHKTIEYITETTPAEAVCVEFTLPVEEEWFVEAFREKIQEVEKRGGRVKVAIFDTIVSMPGVRLPFEKLARLCREMGVLSLVDGAHAVGHTQLDLAELDADFFVSNCHKWLHVPRGCALFHVPTRNHHLLRSTLPTSHGFIPKPRRGVTITNPLPSVGTKSAYITNFEFVGTIDNSPYLCVPDAIKWRASIGGEEKIMKYCQDLARKAAHRAAEILGTEVLDNSTGSLTRGCALSNTRLPLEYAEIEAVGVKAGVAKEDVGVQVRNWLSRAVIDEYDTFMALMFYGGAWWVRWSGQVYLELEDFEWGAERLKELCARVREGEFAVAKSA
ncbi:PLP-dependent transferase [Westerdykella ornata]|uniref:PLP-dependent transferase n=1 Tax=Westerdykella ornata TaxID=318751 RepID=A0A6A6JRM0_WESOR|nr:PLP-dependent transferase [Westerdykella ornata]KAF2279270.1 PLP-dependent transferase [Westerdykella ornata]